MFHLKIDYEPVNGSDVQNVLSSILMTGLGRPISVEVSSRPNIIGVEHGERT